MIATCSSSEYFPKIVEWSFLQQGRSVWRKIPGKKRKPFVTGFTNKLQITKAMKEFGRISELRFGEFGDKNVSKCAVNNGKRKKAEASLVLFSLPIVPRGLSFFPLPSFPSTQGGLGGRGGDG